MLCLLQLIFLGHFHKWKVIETNNLTINSEVKGRRYIQQCEHCGKVIKRDLI